MRRYDSGKMRDAAALMSVLIAAYAISQFLRNSIGVIAPDLSAELGVDAARIGLLSSAFFLTFAAAQVPIGVAIDRYGPKITMVVCAVIAVAGTLVFALATSANALIAARMMIGLGCASFFMAPLAIYARRFPPERFAALTSVQLGCASFGTLFATAPLAISAGTIGWRASFIVVAVLTAVVGLAIALVVPPDRDTRREPESWAAAFRGVAQAVRVRSFWPVFMMHMTTYGAFASVVGLWAGPWLTDVHGAGLQTRGAILLGAALAQIVGLFAWGFADRYVRSYVKAILVGSSLSAMLLIVAAIVPLGLWGAGIWLAVFGFCIAYTPIVTALGKSLFPEHLTGRGITLMNIGTMGGAFALQTATGYAVSLFARADGAYPAAAYQVTFGLLGVALGAAILLFLRVADRHPLRHADQA